MKNKDTQNVKLKSGKEVEVHKNFYLNGIVQAIETSEGIYSCPAHKAVTIGTIKMLFSNFQLRKYMDDLDVTKEDFKNWFEEPTAAVGADRFVYDKLFGDEYEDEK